MLIEYKSQIAKNEQIIDERLSISNSGFDPGILQKENGYLTNRKTIIRNEIEKMLGDIGINLKA